MDRERALWYDHDFKGQRQMSTQLYVYDLFINCLFCTYIWATHVFLLTFFITPHQDNILIKIKPNFFLKLLQCEKWLLLL